MKRGRGPSNCIISVVVLLLTSGRNHQDRKYASSFEMAGTTRICMCCRNHQRSAHVVGATMFMALMVLLHQSYRSGNDPFTSSLLLRFSFTTHPSSSLSLEKVMAPRKELPSSTQPPLARVSPAPSIFGEVIKPTQQALTNVAANPPTQLEGGTGTAARLAISKTSTNGSKITHKGPDATERSRVNHGSRHENLAVPELQSSATPDDLVENRTESGRNSKHSVMSSSQPALATTAQDQPKRGDENPTLQELRAAKEAIAQATPDCADPNLHTNLYKNVTAFSKSYELMEKVFKVYVYRDGSKPLVHSGPKTGIYASEGQFLERIRRPNNYLVRDPWKAHMFFLPYSVQHMVSHLYVPNSHTMLPLASFIKNYVNSIASRYSFWNRTQGADHFFVSCHDWGPATARDHPTLRRNAVKVVCNADISEEFILGKDASLPEVYLHSQKLPLRLGGPGYNKRPILAFFAGQMHGRVRPTLLAYWKDKDPDMKIFEVIPKPIARKMSYMQHMKSSKYCICAMGFEVNSPRIVESIYYDCVPVLIADNFVLPFSDVLNWDSFSVTVPEKDIPNLKSILLSIPDSKYRSLQSQLRHVRQHFVWHEKPEKYDIFNMILHSVWTSRLNRFEEQVPNTQ